MLMLDQERKRLKDGGDSLDGFINDDDEESEGDDSSLEGFIVKSDDSDGEYRVKKKDPFISTSSRETSKAPSKGKCTIPCTIVHGFFRKMAPKSPAIFITFSDTY